MEVENLKIYPGKFLGYIYDYSIGECGAYRKEDKIFSSLYGKLVIDKSFKPPKISVKNDQIEYIPKINDEVYVKILKTSKYFANCVIISTNSKPLKTPIHAMIKSSNVKDDFRDLEMFDCYIPGDIVKGKIISIDQTNFIYISTKDISEGATFSWSSLTKNLMMPINYERMICLKSKIQENRKVAKPSFSQ